jgi:hypothetical protein
MPVLYEQWSFAAAPITLLVNGDYDDHLRLSAMIALATSADDPLVDQEARSACLTPTTSWAVRLEAVAALLRRLRKSSNVVLVDPDALLTTSGNESEDEKVIFRAERREFAEEILRHSAISSWKVYRPSPLPAHNSYFVTYAIGGADEQQQQAEELLGVPLFETLTTWSPGVLQIAAGLVRAGVQRPVDIASFVEVGEPDASAFLEYAWARLPRRCRETAERVAWVRNRLAMNGSFGAFEFADGELSPQQVCRESVAELQRRGWLVCDNDGLLYMHNDVRRFCHLRSTFARPALPQAIHHSFAERYDATLDEQASAEVLEVHYHAIEAGLGDLAIRSARFYGSDLRVHAYRLSRAGEFEQAAQIYQRMVDDFDKQDAYAWHYLGYNLARTNAAGNPAIRAKIQTAYEVAKELEPRNPLYHGRLLAFQTGTGDVPIASYGELMRLFAHSPESLGFAFAPILETLNRSNKSEALREVRNRYGGQLRRSAHLRDKFSAVLTEE